MARVLLRDSSADKYNLLSARLSIILKRPVKYSEAVEILSTADDEMLASLTARYSYLKDSACCIQAVEEV